MGRCSLWDMCIPVGTYFLCGMCSLCGVCSSCLRCSLCSPPPPPRLSCSPWKGAPHMWSMWGMCFLYGACSLCRSCSPLWVGAPPGRSTLSQWPPVPPGGAQTLSLSWPHPVLPAWPPCLGGARALLGFTVLQCFAIGSTHLCFFLFTPAAGPQGVELAGGHTSCSSHTWTHNLPGQSSSRSRSLAQPCLPLH